MKNRKAIRRRAEQKRHKRSIRKRRTKRKVGTKKERREAATEAREKWYRRALKPRLSKEELKGLEGLLKKR